MQWLHQILLNATITSFWRQSHVGWHQLELCFALRHLPAPPDLAAATKWATRTLWSRETVYWARLSPLQLLVVGAKVGAAMQKYWPTWSFRGGQLPGQQQNRHYDHSLRSSKQPPHIKAEVSVPVTNVHSVVLLPSRPITDNFFGLLTQTQWPQAESGLLQQWPFPLCVPANCLLYFSSEFQTDWERLGVTS